MNYSERNRAINLIVQMTDLEVMERFCRVVGGHPPRSVKHPTNPAHNPVYRWTASSKDYIADFTRVIGPLLGTRRQAALGLVNR